MTMAVMQTMCTRWQPALTQRRSAKTMMGAEAVGIPVLGSCDSVRLERREAGAKLVSRFCSSSSEKRSLAIESRDDFGRRELSHIVMARRGGSQSPGESRPSTSRGPPSKQQQHESSRKSSSNPISRKKARKVIKREDDGGDDEGFDEDALEALFAQLEMDLESGDTSDGVDFSEEDVIELENELAAALRDIEEDEEELRTNDVVAEDERGQEYDDRKGNLKTKRNRGKSDGLTSIEVKDRFTDTLLEEFGEELAEPRVVTLEPWQLRKLAAAVEMGRRKVNIKALSAEVGMDRFDVLSWLKDPPPELLMYSATMEDEEIADELREAGKSSNSSAISSPAVKQDVGPDLEDGRSWHSQKRLRKEHEATFERVFSSTDRPSNTILQNLVELTHVPRKRIVGWFEQRRKLKKTSPKFEALR